MKKLLLALRKFGSKKIVKLLMSRFVRKIHKIFNAIVKLIPVLMVDSLFRKKIPAKMFFHHKAMLTNIILRIKRMFRRIDTNISSTFSSPTFPIRAFFAFKRLAIKITLFSSTSRMRLSFIPRRKSFLKSLFSAIKRTSIGCILAIRMNIKNLSTSLTNFFNFFFFVPSWFPSDGNSSTFLRTIFSFAYSIRMHFKRFITICTKNSRQCFSHSYLPVLLIIPFIFLCVNIAYSADSFEQGDGSSVIESSTNISDIDTNLEAYLTEPLSRLLQDFREGAELEYSSDSELTVAAGQVTVKDSSGSVKAMLSNSSSTTVTWSDIDTGAENDSTTYYVYAYATTPASDLDFDIAISLSSTAPSGITYYRRLGTFYNNSSSNIDYDSVRNDGFYTTKLGDWESKSNNTTYQADTDGFVVAYGPNTASYGYIQGKTDSSNPPTTVRARQKAGQYESEGAQHITFPVKRNDYWKTETSLVTATVFFIPSENE